MNRYAGCVPSLLRAYLRVAVGSVFRRPADTLVSVGSCAAGCSGNLRLRRLLVQGVGIGRRSVGSCGVGCRRPGDGRVSAESCVVGHAGTCGCVGILGDLAGLAAYLRVVA
ncbi:hypothetical protein BTHE_2019 [Bifidobacterium thermophilum]|nr:hypothetical protein BTHE_2019 [Bifidobacterium thermophilum]